MVVPARGGEGGDGKEGQTAAYAMSGTNMLHAATAIGAVRCARMVLPGTRSYCRSCCSGLLSPYAMPGTDIAYAAISLRDFRY
eukprot:3211261-Rhodomonas_salina.1